MKNLLTLLLICFCVFINAQNTFNIEPTNKVLSDQTYQTELFYQSILYHKDLKLYDRSSIKKHLSDNNNTYLIQFQDEINKLKSFNKDEVQQLIDKLVENAIILYLSESPILKTSKQINPDNPIIFGPGDPCINMGFDNCNYTGWTLTQGLVDGNPYGFVSPVPTVNWGNGSVIGFPPGTNTGDQHYIVGPGTDPNTPIPFISPFNGGTCSALLGDGTGTNYHASRISQMFRVDVNNANYSYSYAVVLQDPGTSHSLGEKPYFSVKMFDTNGNIIPCSEYKATAGDGSPGWITSGGLVYKDWSLVIVPLQAYIGQDVTIEYTVGDCDFGGHYGYAYLNANCTDLPIIASDTIVCGTPITLNAPSPFNGTYLWNTGATTPSITVTTGGTYSVDLITSPGCFITIDIIVTEATSLPVADFIADTVCIGSITNFTDISSSSTLGPITGWEWDFNNDGIVDNTTQNPTYNFPNVGTFPVHLTITGQCGHDTIIYIVVTPTVDALFTFTTECFGTAISFTDNSTGNGGTITNWEWDFNNDGIVDNTTQNPTYNFPSVGTFPVQLIVSAGGSCQDTITHMIIINPIPVANFINTTVCQGIATTFTNQSTIITGTITNWAWLFGDIAGGSSNVQNPTYTYATAGTYNVTLVVTSDNGCIHTITLNVEVYPNPTANFSINDVCLNTNSNFIDLSTVQAPGMINQWNWTFNPGLGTSNIQSPTIVYTNTGQYSTTLQVTTIHGCTDDTTLITNIHPFPVVDFGPDTAGCDPVCVTMTNNTSISAGTVSNFIWNFGDGSSSGTETPHHCFRNLSHSGITEYDITLTAVSDQGCVTTETHPQAIVVWPIPLAHFEISPEITDIYQPEISFTDLSIIASTWDWDFGDSIYSTDTNPIHEFQDTGFYLVTLYIENSYGCKDTTDKIVRIRPAYAIWIPNVFTPNSDGDNDFFYIDGYGIKEVDLYIFDRWGLQLLHDIGTDHTKVVWNGIYKGEIVQQDVYIYKAKVKDVFNKYHRYIGRVTVIK